MGLAAVDEPLSDEGVVGEADLFRSLFLGVGPGTEVVTAAVEGDDTLLAGFVATERARRLADGHRYGTRKAETR